MFEPARLRAALAPAGPRVGRYVSPPDDDSHRELERFERRLEAAYTVAVLQVYDLPYLPALTKLRRSPKRLRSPKTKTKCRCFDSSDLRRLS